MFQLHSTGISNATSIYGEITKGLLCFSLLLSLFFSFSFSVFFSSARVKLEHGQVFSLQRLQWQQQLQCLEANKFVVSQLIINSSKRMSKSIEL